MKKIDMKKVISNIKTVNKKKLLIFGSAATLIGGTIALVSCNNNNQNVNNSSIVTDDTNLDKNNSNNVKPSTTTTTSSNNKNNSNVTIDANEVETIEVTIDSEDVKESEEIVPAVVYMTAEDLVKLSKTYAEYINKVGVFTTENYAYNKFEAKDLYSAVYLSNIDCFTDEETKRLIDNGIINDDIGSVVVNSFGFFNFYQTDTYHKAKNGDKNLIDLSMLFVNDKKAEKTFETMNAVLGEMSTVDNNKLSSNFVDTYAYFAAGVELPVSNYDYSKSIYTSDRSQLAAGSVYALSYAAEVIKDLSVEKGVATWAVGNTLSEVINDRSDIVRIFDGCTATKENTNEPSKVLTK